MAAKTAKVENYTAEATARIKAEYMAAVAAGADYEGRKAVIESLAVALGKGTKSIVAKLTREGVYQAKEYVTKAGEKPVKKDERADAIGRILKLSEPDTDSLAKANRKALAAIFSALANSVPVEAETPESLAAKGPAIASIAEAVGLSADEATSLSRVRGEVLAKIAVALV